MYLAKANDLIQILRKNEWPYSGDLINSHTECFLHD